MLPPTDPLTSLSDEDVLAKLRDGDRDVFGALVRRYERELFGYLKRYLGDDELAADVFQNTFLAVFLKIDQYELGRPARPWLYTIATNQAIDALRKQTRRNERTADFFVSGKGDSGEENRPFFDLLTDRDIDPAERVVGIEEQLRVRESVDQLPEILRHVVILAYFQGLKYNEIAEILGIPLGTVKSRLHAALLKLAEVWKVAETLGQEERE